jgi:hypothetical protein
MSLVITCYCSIVTFLIEIYVCAKPMGEIDINETDCYDMNVFEEVHDKVHCRGFMLAVFNCRILLPELMLYL